MEYSTAVAKHLDNTAIKVRQIAAKQSVSEVLRDFVNEFNPKYKTTNLRRVLKSTLNLAVKAKDRKVRLDAQKFLITSMGQIEETQQKVLPSNLINISINPVKGEERCI
jgi:hypothetical protein